MRAPRRTAALLCGAALIAGVGACGGDDEEDSAAPATQAEPATTGEEASKPAEKGKDGLTPPGTKLKIGDSATVGWQPPSLSVGGKPKTIDLEVAVVALEKRSQDDLEGVNLDDEQKSATPYFLKVRVENVGETGPPEDDPDLAFDAIDDRGQEQGSITFIGDFEPCEDADPPRPFERGKSYESCLTYLVPGGGSIEEIRWKDGPVGESGLSEYFEKPIVWAAG